MENILIEAVQMHPCIFDKSATSYKNKLAKEKAWMTVAAATGVSVKQCESRWRSLRDRYVKESRKAPSGSAAKESSGWKYLEAMSFLQRHVTPRRTFGNTSFASVDSLTPQADSVQSEPLFEIFEEEIFGPNIAQSSPIAHCIEEPTPSTSRQAKRKRDEDRLDSLCGAVSGWLQKQESTSQPVSRNEEFLKVLDSYLLKHSEEDQDRMKIDILNFVFNNGQRA